MVVGFFFVVSFFVFTWDAFSWSRVQTMETAFLCKTGVSLSVHWVRHEIYFQSRTKRKTNVSFQGDGYPCGDGSEGNFMLVCDNVNNA